MFQKGEVCKARQFCDDSSANFKSFQGDDTFNDW